MQPSLEQADTILAIEAQRTPEIAEEEFNAAIRLVMDRFRTTVNPLIDN